MILLSLHSVMAKNYFKSYIWLLETLQSRGPLTLAEIKKSGDIAHYGNFTKPLTSAYTTALRTELTSFVESCITGGGMTVEQALANLDAAFADVRALN